MNSPSLKILYKELIERYSNLHRRISFINKIVLNKYEAQINKLIENIDNLILDDKTLISDKGFISDLKNLINKLENLLTVDLIEEYNHLIENQELNLNNNTRLETNSINNAFHNALNPNVVWDGILSFLKKELNVHTYNVWVKPINFDSIEGNTINVKVQNLYFKNWLEEHCANMIKKHLKEADLDYDIKFITA